MTQTALMKGTNENYKSESIQIKSKPMKSVKSIQKPEKKRMKSIQTKKKIYDLKKCIRHKTIRIKSIPMESIQMISIRIKIYK